MSGSADFTYIQSVKETQILYFRVDFANRFVDLAFNPVLSSSLALFVLITGTEQC